MTLQKDPLIHAHKAQDRAEINIIRYMKRVKTDFFASKLVQFSKQISKVNILAPVRDNPSKILLRGSFGVMGFALQITWTVKFYEPTSTPEKLCVTLAGERVEPTKFFIHPQRLLCMLMLAFVLSCGTFEYNMVM